MNAFTLWLSAQVKREDPVGDLARDAGYDIDFPTSGKLSDYRDHLTDVGACRGALAALSRAWFEFQETGR